LGHCCKKYFTGFIVKIKEEYTLYIFDMENKNFMEIGQENLLN
jgi:hypothetical protein